MYVIVQSESLPNALNLNCHAIISPSLNIVVKHVIFKQIRE